MSLDNYQNLAQIQPAELGCELPQLFAGSIKCESQLLTAAGVIERVAEFAAEQGWVLYRDHLQLQAGTPIREDFIEGEWHQSGNTIKVKLLNNNSYLLTSMYTTEVEDQQQVYREQIMEMRSGLVDGSQPYVIYRTWWTQEQSGAQHGRWLPLVQQFVGVKIQQGDV